MNVKKILPIVAIIIAIPMFIIGIFYKDRTKTVNLKGLLRIMRELKVYLKYIINFIYEFYKIAQPIFYKLLYMSIIAAVIGFVILIIRKIFDKKISPTWKFGMWILFIIALIVPINIKTNVSIYSNIPDIEQVQYISYSQEYTKIKQENKANSIDYDMKWAKLKEEKPDGDFSYVNEEDISTVAEVQQRKDNITKGYIKSLIIDVIIPLTYLACIILGFILMIGYSIHLNIKLKSTYLEDERIRNILENCKKELNIKKDIKILMQNIIKVPSIYGLFKPKILFHEDLLNLDDNALRYVILHELAHYKRKDVLLNYVLLSLEIVYWFNPLLWPIFKAIRNDIELRS